jgi:hypothetical protein
VIDPILHDGVAETRWKCDGAPDSQHRLHPPDGVGWVQRTVAPGKHSHQSGNKKSPQS